MTAQVGATDLRHSGLNAGGESKSPAFLPWFWTGALALGVQLFLVKLLAPHVSASVVVAWVIFASHLLLIPFLIRNGKYLGIKLILVGLGLNLLAMATNGGMMPASAEGVVAVTHQEASVSGARVVGSKDVYKTDPNLPELSDRFIVRLPGHLVKVLSVGDLVIYLGTLCALASLSKTAVGLSKQSAEAV